MVKINLLLAIVFIFNLCQATTSSKQVQYTWLGATGLIFKADTNVVQIDTYTSRPDSILSAFGKLDSDIENASDWATKVGLKYSDAILITHTHFDHIIDIKHFSQYGSPLIYGTKSAKNFSIGQGIKANRIKVIGHQNEFEIGDFKVKSIKLEHAPNLKKYIVFNGEIKKKKQLPMYIWQMKEGGSLGYQIRFKDKKYLIHASSIASPHIKNYNTLQSDVLFLSIANRKSTKDQIDKIISKVNPKIIIPIHYEGEFGKLTPYQAAPNGDNIKEWISTVKLRFPNINIQLPQLAKWQRI